MKQRPTPAPWYNDKGQDLVDPDTICGPNGGMIAEGLSTANANHIVHCINIHAELMAALNSALVALKRDERDPVLVEHILTEGFKVLDRAMRPKD